MYTIKFLKLENHFPDFSIFQPLPLYNLEDLPYPVSTFHYDKRTSLLFLGLSDASISGKINNYFSKFKSLVKNSVGGNEQPPGLLLVYNIIKNNSGAIHFELLWEKNYSSEITSINFYDKQNMLLIGLNNGNIYLNKIYINESSQVTKELVDELGMLKSHKKRVIGACINFQTGYVYSVARENTIHISEVNYCSFLKNFQISKKEFSCFIYEEVQNRLILTDDAGSIWILDLSSSVSK
jgi:hypothetical protein